MNKQELKKFAKTLPDKPGIYQMINSSGKVIYVGKAKNLKNRVLSYFNVTQESPKTLAMINKVSDINFVVTNSEPDALLLESNLIKELRPRYNITFRDDKSYPYLYLTSKSDYPRLSFYRGSRKGPGRYFGPYPNAGASRRTLNIVQKLFKLRQCDDAFFKHRNRPCLQYQIDRCSAPCVNLISKKDYAKDIQLATLFMEGKNEKVMDSLTTQMESDAADLEYEKAAKIRNQISLLRTFNESQHIISDKGEADYIACSIESGLACVQVFIIRGGRNLGNKIFFPALKLQQQHEEVIAAFIKQHYLRANEYFDVPGQIYTSHIPDDLESIKSILSIKHAEKKIKFSFRPKGERAKIMELAQHNAALAINHKLSKKIKYQAQLEALSSILDCEETVQRIECFDISHHSGKGTMGSGVAFGASGAIKSDYRKYTLKDITPGDDYQAMEQVLRRHFLNIQKQDRPLPDVVLIDGGKGQLSKINSVFNELQLVENIKLLGIAKGPGRKPGLEKLYVPGNKSALNLDKDPSVLLLLQEIRDEAHRFAISGHRKKINRELTRTPLDEIKGIGKTRKQRLILHFGGLQGIKSASVDDIVKVPGISKDLAEKIYTRLH
ncbi:MAG: excinuclease ABC subunit UvrC [Gammaproteobacteria bacterium]|nr:excinuclease ABC subunit UvrC [Gammaproteobacteria bacterium]